MVIDLWNLPRGSKVEGLVAIDAAIVYDNFQLKNYLNYKIIVNWFLLG